MSELKVVVVTVGRMDVDEVEAAANRISKIIRRPIELREPVPVPRESEDTTRNQHRAKTILDHLRRSMVRAKVSKLVGATASGAPVATTNPDATLFVTDVDLFTATKEGVFGHLDPAHKAGVLSVRRLREAFYRRKADPSRQRARLVKQMLRAIGITRDLPDCSDPTCVMSAAQVVADVDRKQERFCGACARRMATGAFSI